MKTWKKAAAMAAIIILLLLAAIAVYGKHFFYTLPHSGEKVGLFGFEKREGPGFEKSGWNLDRWRRSISYHEWGYASSGGGRHAVEVLYSDQSIEYHVEFSEGRTGGATEYNCMRGNCGFAVLYDLSYTAFQDWPSGSLVCFSNSSFVKVENGTETRGEGCPKPS